MTTLTLIVGDEVGNPISGESRFVVNLARSLKDLGVDVVLCAASVTEAGSQLLEQAGVRVASIRANTKSFVSQSRLLIGGRGIARRLAKLALDSGKCDWYVVFDQAVGAARYLGRGRKAFICNGDFALLFLTQGFYRQGALLKWMLSWKMSDAILGNARSARQYDLRLANSKFTQSFMSYLYECSFEGILYPPVDPAVFHPFPSFNGRRYILSMMRNSNEQNLHVLERIARRVPVKVVGTARVPGAESTGYVRDTELAQLYSGASLLAFPIVSEFFGYAVAESLACATPALVMSGTGPSEIVPDQVCGWHAKDENEFVVRAVDLYNGGYDPSFRVKALETSNRFTLNTVGRSFLSQLERVTSQPRTA